MLNGTIYTLHPAIIESLFNPSAIFLGEVYEKVEGICISTESSTYTGPFGSMSDSFIVFLEKLLDYFGNPGIDFDIVKNFVRNNR